MGYSQALSTLGSLNAGEAAPLLKRRSWAEMPHKDSLVLQVHNPAFSQLYLGFDKISLWKGLLRPTIPYMLSQIQKAAETPPPFFCISFGGKICHEMRCDHLQSLFIQFIVNLHAFCCKNINNVFDQGCCLEPHLGMLQNLVHVLNNIRELRKILNSKTHLGLRS